MTTAAVPKRIRFPRGVKGWRKPPNTVMVTRASRWGNPFIIADDLPRELRHLKPGDKVRRGNMMCTVVATREEAVTRFRDEHMTPERRAAARRELKGKDVACSCDLNKACHGDVLLEIANS